MATSKKAQAKAGVPGRRRGQQMGDERSGPGKMDEDEKKTPALRGRRKGASKFFADESSQNIGSGGEGPRDNSPSTPAAIATGGKVGESGGERTFKARQKGAGRKRR